VKPHPSSSDSVADYIKKHKSPLREIVSELRKLVMSSSPGVSEDIKWGRPWYSKNGYLCYISTAKAHVTFGFSNGARLNDPRGLLEGTGKGMRHVKLRSLDDIDRSLFRGWLKEAVRLNNAGHKPI
jgi:hypothetical protein